MKCFLRSILLGVVGITAWSAHAGEFTAWTSSQNGFVKPSSGGLHFDAAGAGWAFAPWEAGAQPFALAWEAEIQKGVGQAWRLPGVAVALATAAPDAMGSNDVAVVISMHLDGICASVRRGPTFEPNRNETGWPPKFSNLGDKDLSQRFELNQGGAGGRLYSVEWPNRDLPGTRLAFRMSRTATNTLQFAFFHHQYGEGQEPWWTREWTMPADIAGLAFKYVVVRTVLNPGDYKNPGRPPEGGTMAGEIQRMRGELGEKAAGLAGGISARTGGLRVEPRETLPNGGEVVSVLGEGFARDSVVHFNDAPVSGVEFVDVSRLKVRVPRGKVGRVKVTVKGHPGEAFFGYAPHPYLHFHGGELPDLRKKFNEPMFAGYRSLVLQNAKAVPAGGHATEKSGRAGIPDLTWAYLLTGEAKYKEALLAVLATEAASLQHEEFRMMAGETMAVAYDALFSELPVDLRVKMEKYLERVATVYVRNVKKNAWWYAGNISNTIPVGGAGGGAAGLALMHSTPVAEEAAKLAGPTTKRLYQAISPDGGCNEGTLYWNYGLTSALRLGHMLQNATGNDEGLLDTPALRKNVRFVETQIGGDGRFFTFNDTQPWLTGLAVCADFGSRYNQPLMLWMADHMAGALSGQGNRPSEVARGDVVPFAFLWRSRQPAPPDFPGVPTVSHLEVMNWGVLRSDGSFQPKLVVGVKGSDGPLTHHAQPDLGSFVLHANGEAYLIDPGYYQDKHECHSLPLVDGQGPDRRGKGVICDEWERGMAVDSTAAYKGATRVRRQFVRVADMALVVLDDLVADGKVTTHFQCGFKTELSADKLGAVIRGKKGRLALRVFGPVNELKVEGPIDFGKSWVFKKLAEAGEVEWFRLEGSYAADPANPLVTVLTPASGNAEPAPVAVKRGAGTITVAIGGQPPVVFRQKETGWVRDPPA